MLFFNGNPDQVYSTEVFNNLGKKQYASTGFQSKFDLSDQASGVYFVHVLLDSKTINLKVIVKK